MAKFPKRYVYPAILSPCEDRAWEVFFPDLDNCFTAADSLGEALEQARCVLEDCLVHREMDKDEIPEPTPLQQIETPDGSLCQLVVAVMAPVRRAWSQRAVKKTLTIPSYLAELAEEHRVNYSALLQRALRDEMDVQ